jgi:hypothetical protein
MARGLPPHGIPRASPLWEIVGGEGFLGSLRRASGGTSRDHSASGQHEHGSRHNDLMQLEKRRAHPRDHLASGLNDHPGRRHNGLMPLEKRRRGDPRDQLTWGAQKSHWCTRSGRVRRPRARGEGFRSNSNLYGDTRVAIKK